MLNFKDIITSILFFVGIGTSMVIASVLDSMPIFYLVLVAIFVWIVFIVVLFIDAAKRRRVQREGGVWIKQDGQWVDLTSKNSPKPIVREAQFFDQDADKENA